MATADAGLSANPNRSLFVSKVAGTGYDTPMDPLTEILKPARLTAVVDVGANPIDGDPPYSAMLAAGLCEVTGFEPQASALQRLGQKNGPLQPHFPYCFVDVT